MSYVYIHANLDEEVSVQARTAEYAVRIGEATLLLPPAKAAELYQAIGAALAERDINYDPARLAAALDESRTSGGTDVDG